MKKSIAIITLLSATAQATCPDPRTMAGLWHEQNPTEVIITDFSNLDKEGEPTQRHVPVIFEPKDISTRKLKEILNFYADALNKGHPYMPQIILDPSQTGICTYKIKPSTNNDINDLAKHIAEELQEKMGGFGMIERKYPPYLTEQQEEAVSKVIGFESKIKNAANNGEKKEIEDTIAKILNIDKNNETEESKKQFELAKQVTIQRQENVLNDFCQTYDKLKDTYPPIITQNGQNVVIKLPGFSKEFEKPEDSRGYIVLKKLDPNNPIISKFENIFKKRPKSNENEEVAERPKSNENEEVAERPKSNKEIVEQIANIIDKGLPRERATNLKKLLYLTEKERQAIIDLTKNVGVAYKADEAYKKQMMEKTLPNTKDSDDLFQLISAIYDKNRQKIIEKAEKEIDKHIESDGEYLKDINGHTPSRHRNILDEIDPNNIKIKAFDDFSKKRPSNEVLAKQIINIIDKSELSSKAREFQLPKHLTDKEKFLIASLLDSYGNTGIFRNFEDHKRRFQTKNKTKEQIKEQIKGIDRSIDDSDIPLLESLLIKLNEEGSLSDTGYWSKKDKTDKK